MRETRDALQDAVETARERLDEAIDAADAAVAAAEGGSAAARARSRAIELRTGQARALDDAEGIMGWSSRSAVARPVPALNPPLDEDSVDRRLREDADGDDSPTLLKAADIPPIMYEDGKTVMGGDFGSSGDRLQMRGMPIIWITARQLRYGVSSATSPSDYPQRVVYDLASIRNNRPDLVAGLRITRDGLVVDMGGKYAEGTDFRSESFAIIPLSNTLRPFGTVAGSGQGSGYDLTLEFGRPTAAPEGNAEHFWAAALMPTPGQIAAAGGDGGWLKDGERTLPLGVYHVRLSNHIGLDRRTEDPDGPAYPDDDANLYLAYAAYGFMDFFRPSDASADSVGTGRRALHRVFPFHVGYDAFNDEAGTRTADISDAIINAKFKGRTIALQFRFVSSEAPFLNHADTKRMRGDVELTATIGTGSDTITGKISNMEDWDPKGYWEPSTTIDRDIVFAPGQIDSKGEFAGIFGTSSEYPTSYTASNPTGSPPTHPGYPPGFYRGGYRGNFYGPRDGLEAAGTWAMSPAIGQRLSIAGSFGAALVRPDGSYGAEVSADD